jgi:hypothetical protein
MADVNLLILSHVNVSSLSENDRNENEQCSICLATISIYIPNVPLAKPPSPTITEPPNHNQDWTYNIINS